MDIVSFTELRANMASHFDRVLADRTELVVKRGNKEPVVILALADLEGMRETLHLLSNEANAAHLKRSLADFERGNTVTIEFPET